MSKPRTSESTSAGAQPQQQETGLQSFASLCGTLIVGLFVLAFVFENFMIPSASMASTILVGDHILVDRASLSPASHWAPVMPYRELRRGEPVVFYKPLLEPDGQNLILVKRCIGVPGDRIHLRNGVVYLNGVAQSDSPTEAHATQPTAANYDAYVDDFPSLSGANVRGVTAEWALDLPNHIQGDDLVVPPDSYFVMGDNRANSLDSRYWGFVPRASLIGRPLFIYWSFVTPGEQMDKTSLADQARFAAHEFLHFFDDTRWHRTLQPVN